MSPDTPLAQRILQTIAQEQWAVGTHLPAQALADRFGVSRSPVNQALTWLAQHQLVKREPNRGFFVQAPALDAKPSTVNGGLAEPTVTSQAYLRLADDCFNGLYPQSVSESRLRERYGLSATQLKSLLHRAVQEGWAQKKSGYGWTLSPMLNSPESLMQTYRLRIAVEPAALLEPGYHLAPAALARLRDVEHHLLNGGIETDSPIEIYERGVNFHETLVEASGNPFFIETLRRVNRIRRLIAYRSMQDRHRFGEQCKQHLKILDLLAKGQTEKVADYLRWHLESALRNHQKIQKLLKPSA